MPNEHVLMIVGAVAAVATGAGFTWWWLRPAMGATLRRTDELERALLLARQRLHRVSTAATEVVATATARIDRVARELEIAADAVGVVGDDMLARLKNRTTAEARTTVNVAGVQRRATTQANELEVHQRELAGNLEGVVRAARALTHWVDAAARAGDAADTAEPGDDRADAGLNLTAVVEHAVAAASAASGGLRRVETTARSAAERAAQVSTDAERGYGAAYATLEAIARIRDLTDTARQRLDTLGARVADIGDVVRVIEEITEKTKLLALNASIIAAQAGEHGRSFAVVAREIKALAQRTAASTREIGEQIRAVQAQSARATEAMQAGHTAVTEGVGVARDASASLDAIREGARAAHTDVEAMTSALLEQARAVARVAELAAGIGQHLTPSPAHDPDGERVAGDRAHGRELAARLAEHSQEAFARARQQQHEANAWTAIAQELVDAVAALTRSDGEHRALLAHLDRGARAARTQGTTINVRARELRDTAADIRREVANLDE